MAKLLQHKTHNSTRTKLTLITQYLYYLPISSLIWFLPADEDSNQIELETHTQSEPKTIIRKLRKDIWALISEVFNSFLSAQADVKLADMEKRGVSPNFSNDEYGQLRKRDFQTVTKELYCVEPRISYKLNDTQEKSLLGFLNLLLSSEERENVLQIIEQVVSLTTEQRKNFAKVLGPVAER